MKIWFEIILTPKQTNKNDTKKGRNKHRNIKIPIATTPSGHCAEENDEASSNCG
jgi:hypothetical protein